MANDGDTTVVATPATGTPAAGKVPTPVPAGAAAPPSPANKDFFVKPDGTYIEKFWEHPQFPAELKDNMQLRTHKTLADTLGNWGSMHKSFGFDKIAIPGKDAKQEVWDENVWSRLGTPKEPKGYEIPDYGKTGLDPKFKASDAEIEDLTKAAHKARLTGWQFKTFTDEMNAIGKTMLEERQRAEGTAAAQAMEPLRREWGPNFDANRKSVEVFLRSRIPPQNLERVMAMGLLDEPGTLKLLYEQGKAFGELQGELALANTPADVLAAADREVRQLTASKAYTSEHDPQHSTTVDRVNELRKMLFAAKAKP